MTQRIKHRKRIAATCRSVALHEDEQSFDRFTSLAKRVLAVSKHEVQKLERKPRNRHRKPERPMARLWTLLAAVSALFFTACPSWVSSLNKVSDWAAASARRPDSLANGELTRSQHPPQALELTRQQRLQQALELASRGDFSAIADLRNADLRNALELASHGDFSAIDSFTQPERDSICEALALKIAATGECFGGISPGAAFTEFLERLSPNAAARYSSELSRRAADVQSLPCIGSTYDPLPGFWRLTGQTWDRSDTGAVMYVDYDSTNGSYSGYLLVLTDSMAARGWSVGDLRIARAVFDPRTSQRPGQCPGIADYCALITQHQMQQITPNNYRRVAVDFVCTLSVVTRESYAARCIVFCEDIRQEVWTKLDIPVSDPDIKRKVDAGLKEWKAKCIR